MCFSKISHDLGHLLIPNRRILKMTQATALHKCKIKPPSSCEAESFEVSHTWLAPTPIRNPSCAETILSFTLCGQAANRVTVSFSFKVGLDCMVLL